MKNSPRIDTHPHDPNPSEAPDWFFSILVPEYENWQDEEKYKKFCELMDLLYENGIQDGLRKKLYNDVLKHPTEYIVLYVGSRAKCILAQADFLGFGADTKVEEVSIS